MIPGGAEALNNEKRKAKAVLAFCVAGTVVPRVTLRTRKNEANLSKPAKVTK